MEYSPQPPHDSSQPPGAALQSKPVNPQVTTMDAVAAAGHLRRP